MDYLKAFTIGTTGPVLFQHMAPLALTDEDYYSYSFKLYSLWLPFHYGLWAMFAVFIRKMFNISLAKSLFIVSILSLTSTAFCNYSGDHCNTFYNIFCKNSSNKNSKQCKQFTPGKRQKPYKDYSTKEWLSYILRNGARHIINFNLIIYYLTKYFSDYYWLRVFIFGSSIFSYFLTYLKVIWADSKNKLNYDYKIFSVVEPFIQGFDLLISLYVLQKILGFKLKTSLIIWNFVGSCLQLLLAYIHKTYKYKGIEWFYYFLRAALFSGLIKAIVIYYLLVNVK